MTVVKGNSGGSWGASHSTPTPMVGQVPIVTGPSKVQKETKITTFEYEDWTIHFQEEEPFAWYMTHNCPHEGPRTAGDIHGLTIKFIGDDKTFIDANDKVQLQTPIGQEHLDTDITCYQCKQKMPKYTYLILRRTQKFLLRGKMPFRNTAST